MCCSIGDRLIWRLQPLQGGLTRGGNTSRHTQWSWQWCGLVQSWEGGERMKRDAVMRRWMVRWWHWVRGDRERGAMWDTVCNKRWVTDDGGGSKRLRVEWYQLEIDRIPRLHCVMVALITFRASRLKRQKGVSLLQGWSHSTLAMASYSRRPHFICDRMRWCGVQKRGEWDSNMMRVMWDEW